MNRDERRCFSVECSTLFLFVILVGYQFRRSINWVQVFLEDSCLQLESSKRFRKLDQVPSLLVLEPQLPVELLIQL
jgi:hypothetical protein